MTTKPMVSVNMVTYNHEKYISQAIKGVLMQKTNFAIQLVIGEDCSTDATREICLRYKEKYPDIIKLVLQEKNVGSKQNAIDTLTACDGKYIASCDGDDYWTDKHKLQKQVDFLEANPDFNICCHNAIHLNESKKILITPKTLITTEFTQEDIANHNFILTLTVVYRAAAVCVDKLPQGFFNSKSSDFFIFMLVSQYGKIKYLPDIMAVYRRHDAGIWTGQAKEIGFKDSIAAHKSFIQEKNTSYEVRENLKHNLVRIVLALHSCQREQGDVIDADSSLSEITTPDYIRILGEELLLKEKQYYKTKEYKIGKLVLAPYVRIRIFISKIMFFIHKLKYD